MKLPIFKARASSAGVLMVSPRSKTETLSETTKSYLIEWLTEQVFGYRKEINTKYTERGILYEDKAIDFIINKLDLSFGVKNEINYEDDFFTGTPDLIIDGVVYDTKCSYSCHTFPFFENDLPNKNYYHQMQVYMHLTNTKKSCIAYVLFDNEEIGHVYNIEDEKRVKLFYVDYDSSIIEELKNRILNCREYINSLI